MLASKITSPIHSLIGFSPTAWQNALTETTWHLFPQDPRFHLYGWLLGGSLVSKRVTEGDLDSHKTRLKV